MKTMVRNNEMIKELDMADIFKVEIVNGEKRVSRWGFFTKQTDGTYAIYKPEQPICRVDDLFDIQEDGPGAIEIVSADEINAFVNEIADEIQGIACMEVSRFTPCGWYYDTIL